MNGRSRTKQHSLLNVCIANLIHCEEPRSSLAGGIECLFDGICEHCFVMFKFDVTPLNWDEHVKSVRRNMSCRLSCIHCAFSLRSVRDLRKNPPACRTSHHFSMQTAATYKQTSLFHFCFAFLDNTSNPLHGHKLTCPTVCNNFVDIKSK
jgi:hypothetical protein